MSILISFISYRLPRIRYEQLKQWLMGVCSSIFTIRVSCKISECNLWTYLNKLLSKSQLAPLAFLYTSGGGKRIYAEMLTSSKSVPWYCIQSLAGGPNDTVQRMSSFQMNAKLREVSRSKKQRTIGSRCKARTFHNELQDLGKELV